MKIKLEEIEKIKEEVYLLKLQVQDLLDRIKNISTILEELEDENDCE